MANDLTHNPLILDTAATISLTQTFYIRKLTFIGAVAGDDAIFQNGKSQEIAHLSAPAANAPDAIDFGYQPLKVTGLILSAIAASGVAHVYLD